MISASCYPSNYWCPIDNEYSECQECGDTFHVDKLNDDCICNYCAQQLKEMEDEENE